MTVIFLQGLTDADFAFVFAQLVNAYHQLDGFIIYSGSAGTISLWDFMLGDIVVGGIFAIIGKVFIDYASKNRIESDE